MGNNPLDFAAAMLLLLPLLGLGLLISSHHRQESKQRSRTNETMRRYGRRRRNK